MIALVRRLDGLVRLSIEEKNQLAAIVPPATRAVDARREFAREGDLPKHASLICEGWACRHKTMPDGRRQIVALLIPGDLCDVNLQLIRQRDHSLGAITSARIAEIPLATLERIRAVGPNVSRALDISELAVGATAHEWVLNVGQRSAYERIAHLMVEMYTRLSQVGLAWPDGIDWPLTQADLADTVGLTPVHVNRTLQQLRRDGVISLSNKRLVIPDLARLRRAAMFNDNYLHFEREARRA